MSEPTGLAALWHRWTQALFALSPRTTIGVGVVLCALVAVLDVLSPPLMNLSFAYVFIILIVTWNAGLRAGIAFTVVASLLQVFVLRGVDPAGTLRAQWVVALFNRWFMFLLVLALVHPLRRLYDSQQAIARIDWLTGGANRKHFEEVLRAEISRSTRAGDPLTAVYIDCDDFKLINDSFGHIQGDAMLRAVVETARQNARPSDTVARLGGDEFALLLPNTDADNAGMIVGRMNTRLLEAMAKNHWPMTFSIGVATFRKRDLTPEEVIGSADSLMYRAKQSGKGRIVCETYGPDTQAAPQPA